MQDMLFRIREVNRVPEEVRKTVVPFQVDGVEIGKVLPENSQRLLKSGVFAKDDMGCLTFADSVGDTVEAKTAAVATVMNEMREEGLIKGWREELYPIARGFYDEPVFFMERAAVPVLGALEYGVHLNGLVKQDDGTERMWIGRRSADKSKYPGMLDHIVAGGQPAGLSLMENVVKECLEEAGIPEDITRSGVQAVGAVSYESYDASKQALSRAVLFNYDLWLPQDFVPQPVDGEVQEFFLWSIDQVKESIAQDFPDPIKPNCYTVIIDYLLRAGHVDPDTPGYLDVLRELRSGDCR